MRIGELADAVGVSTKTIRFYEDASVLPESDRSEQGWRVYGLQDVERLRFVRGARSIGLPLSEIRRFLGLRDEGDPACEHVLESITERIEEIDLQLAQLSQLRTELELLHAEGSARPIDRDDMSGCVCELVGARAR